MGNKDHGRPHEIGRMKQHIPGQKYQALVESSEKTHYSESTKSLTQEDTYTSQVNCVMFSTSSPALAY